ncbi:topoisomerase II-associated protein PAT1 [Lipomyces kononenkoae]|uniref:Topoisomerase II-associated protein PAT1 n=1 Tax=Lipomyces kononenkoae TaxID=34357 RepID=A0ACC3SVW0_LIPKO
MSFFGFDPAENPGTRETDSSFYDENGEAEFDDAYDGLAEDLDQNYDELNDETFGAFAEPVGKDFDFSSQTAKAVSALEEEEKILLSHRRQQQHESNQVEPGYQYSRSNVSGTSRNTEPQIFEIPELKPMASLWETDLTSSSAPAGKSAAQQILTQMKGQYFESKKVLSLEEVEAQLLAATRAQAQSQPLQQQYLQPQQQTAIPPLHTHQPQYSPPARDQPSQQQYRQAPVTVQSMGPQFVMPPSFSNAPMRPPSDNQLRRFQEPVYPDVELIRQQVPPAMPSERTMRVPSIPERNDYYQILQQQQQQRQQQHLQEHQRQLQQPPQQQTHGQPKESLAQEWKQPYAPTAYAQENPVVQELPEQSALTEEEMTKELKAARLSRYNGLMTSSDKNHVTRIQLQQLVTEDPFTEDFYYQVYTALHGPKDGQSGVSNTAIAEKYLNEYGRRSRYGLRRQQESMQRMQQRAIAAAKAHPKHEQYVVEGALGKIAFATVKGPRRILDLAKRAAEERV